MKKQDIVFSNVGVNDQMPYMKVDIAKATRLTSNFAISFYQIDYHAVALSITGQSPLKPEETKLMPVSKVVMDIETFNRLLEELNQLKENFEKQIKEGENDR